MSTENAAAPQNDFIGGLAPSTSPAEPRPDDMPNPPVIEVPEPHTEHKLDVAVGEGLVTPETETAHYADGSSATGTAPLPSASPNGSPAVVPVILSGIVGQGFAGQPSPYSQELDEEVPEFPFPPVVSRDSAKSEAESQSIPKTNYQSELLKTSGQLADEVVAHCMSKRAWASEIVAHNTTKQQLATAQKIVANARAMGFSGAGIHTGA